MLEEHPYLEDTVETVTQLMKQNAAGGMEMV